MDDRDAFRSACITPLSRAILARRAIEDEIEEWGRTPCARPHMMTAAQARRLTEASIAVKDELYRLYPE